MAQNVDHVVNRDRCGRCGARHGGNNHLCPVHGAVSEGCCEPPCRPADWVAISERDRAYPSLGGAFELVPRNSVDLSGYTEEPAYRHQVGTEYVHRYWRWRQEPQPEVKFTLRLPIGLATALDVKAAEIRTSRQQLIVDLLAKEV